MFANPVCFPLPFIRTNNILKRTFQCKSIIHRIMHVSSQFMSVDEFMVLLSCSIVGKNNIFANTEARRFVFDMGRKRVHMNKITVCRV